MRGATGRRRGSRTGASACFNPRPPCGGRRAVDGDVFPGQPHFNPRPPCGGRHAGRDAVQPHLPVSIRAPRAGGDPNGPASESPWAGFNPRPPCGGRLNVGGLAHVGLGVSIRAPRAGGDGPGLAPPRRSPRFNPRPPCGGRREKHSRLAYRNLAARSFNPRPPCGGRPGPHSSVSAAACAFQSAPPVRGATRDQALQVLVHALVSIRAPRAGGDSFSFVSVLAFQSAPPVRGAWRRSPRTSDQVSIRAPRAGGDRIYARDQSAPPVRGATPMTLPARCCFNPRPPCGGDVSLPLRGIDVESAPPVRGATGARDHLPDRPGCFNPRPPCGGRLVVRVDVAGGELQRRRVSIRAPRAGGDPCGMFTGYKPTISFNPRPPCGGRPRPAHRTIPEYGTCFNPRPPCGGRHRLANRRAWSSFRAGGDPARRAGIRATLVSIRAPRAGGDLGPARHAAPSKDPVSFNPRPPCGGRRGRAALPDILDAFQSAPPVLFARHRGSQARRFNPRPPCGGRPGRRRRGHHLRGHGVSIRAPRAGGDGVPIGGD